MTLKPEQLDREPFLIVDSFLTPAEWELAQTGFARRWDNGEFRRAGVGSGEAARHDDVRRDTVAWVTDDDTDLAWWDEKLSTIRQRFNLELFLGLQDQETHFAHYAEGSFYRKHLDRFADDDRRVVSFVLYLNSEWEESWGGQLRAHTPAGPVDIVPAPNRAVFFMSAVLLHEVLPTQHPRKSLTGWFRRRMR